MNQVAIEHELTRQHLQTAFEGLFTKYDRNFASDDEIDIMDLTVVRRGRTLEAMKPLDFGEAYRYRRHRKKRRKNKGHIKELGVVEKNMNSLQISNDKPKRQKRVKFPKQDDQMAQKIFESIRNVNQKIVESIPENPRDFNSVFKGIIKRERCEFITRRCKCNCRACFDCVLYTQLIQ
jgi:hypothetical protein